MNNLVRTSVAIVLCLAMAVGTTLAQDVIYSAGPSTTPVSGASNGGFAWADVNGDGLLDVWIPSHNVLLNGVTTFTRDATRTANITFSSNTVGGLLADINGDGKPDLWSTNDNHPESGLYYDSSGVFIRATGTGELATMAGASNVFNGMAVADFNQDNYLDVAWPRLAPGATGGDGTVYPRNFGISMAKGGASGFTVVGNGAAPGNVAIDTTRTFESWGVHFFDANNDGWQDLLMPSIRHGFSPTNSQVDSIGARKGNILYLNDGTGKFKVPLAADLGRTLYDVDSISQGKSWGNVQADTGIVVDDTVRHFEAIGSQWGDLNNDGKMDLIFTGLAADNWNGVGGMSNVVVIYGKGDGSFTYKWNGTSYAPHGLPQVNNIRAWDVGDYNNDGLPDIFGSPNFASRRIWRNNGDGTFTEVSNEVYSNVSGGGGRAGGFVDYDNDGFLDTYTYTGGNSFLQRNGGNSNNWVAFTPVGTGNNKSAIGARFTVYAQEGTLVQTRIIRAEGNAGGGGTPRANFGIGINTSIDSVVVWWPDGTKGSYSGLAVNKYWTIYYGSKIPGATTLATPASGATGVAASGTLTWNAATDAVNYKVQVSLDPTFAKKELLAVDAMVSGTSTPYSLGVGTKYYWRVAAVNGGFMSDYSAVSNFTTTGAAPAIVPTKLSPINNATNQPANVTLAVTPTADASRYQWQVSTLASFTTLAVNDSTADATHTVKLVGGQTYYWRVRGMNDLGRTAWSAVDTFRIMSPPARTTLLLPANGTQNLVSDSVFFYWRPVSGAASYNLQVSTVTSTTTYTTADTTYRVNGLAKLTNYTWKVEAVNAGGTSAYTGTFSFTTVVAAPAVPAAVLPASAAVDQNRLTTFVWNATLNATKYRLQIASDNAFNTIVADTTIALDTTCTIRTPLASISDFYWRVRAENLGGASNYSTARLFSTGTVLDVEEGALVPQEFELYQNYPNPFNPTTTIRYDIPMTAHVKITVYDMLGQEVGTLIDGVQTASKYAVEWNPAGLGSGVYFMRIVAQSQDGNGSFVATKKMVFLK
jgi:hypothetical protein